MAQALSGFKSLGDRGWVGFFSNCLFDRDVKPDAPKGERFHLDSLKEFADWANSDPAHLPALWFWHLPTVKMGKASRVFVAGPFIFARGQWSDTDLAQRAKAYFSSEKAAADPWGMSHGFRYRDEDRRDGVYYKFRSYEISALPVWAAANPVTMFKEWDTMDLKGIVDQMIEKLGVTKEEAEALVSGAQQEKSAAQPAGQKVGEKAEESTTETTTAVTEANVTTEEGGEDVSDDVIAAGYADLLIENNRLQAELTAREEVGKAYEDKLAELKGQVDESTKLLDALKGQVEAMQQREADKASLMPRAVAEAVESKLGAKVDDETVREDMLHQKTTLEKDADGKVSYEADPMGWVMQQAGLE